MSTTAQPKMISSVAQLENAREACPARLPGGWRSARERGGQARHQAHGQTAAARRQPNAATPSVREQASGRHAPSRLMEMVLVETVLDLHRRRGMPLRRD